LDDEGKFVGFDLMIGNPPYVFARSSSQKGFTGENKKYFYESYELAEYQVNLYPLFIEKGCLLLKNRGSLAYITPNNWMTISTNKKIRQFLLKKSNLKIINFLAQVFDSAAVDSSIIIFDNDGSTPSVEILEYINKFQSICRTSTNLFLAQKDYIINVKAFRDKESRQLLEKIDLKSIQLKSIADVKAGLKAYEVGAGVPPQTKEIKEDRAYHAKSRLSDEYFKYLDGENVGRYYLTWNEEYLKWGKNLSRRRTFNLFSNRRILVRQIPSKIPYCINACLTEETILNDLNSMNIINIKIEPELVLAVLNSKLISYWFVYTFNKLQRGTFPQFKVNELEVFPILKDFRNYRDDLLAKVRKIVDVKSKNPHTDISQLDKEINNIIYHLYDLTEEEIKIVEGETDLDRPPA